MNRGMPSPSGVGFAALNDPRLLARMASPRAPTNRSANTTPTLHHHNNQAAVSTVAQAAATIMPPPHTIPKASSSSSGKSTTSSATAPITAAATSSAASWPLDPKASMAAPDSVSAAASYSQHCSRQISQHQPKAATTATVWMPVPTTTTTTTTTPAATNLTTLPPKAAYPFSASNIRALSSPNSIQVIAHSNRIGVLRLSTGQLEGSTAKPQQQNFKVTAFIRQTLPQRQVQQANQAKTTVINVDDNRNNRPLSATTASASPVDTNLTNPLIRQMPTVNISQNTQQQNYSSSNSNNDHNSNNNINNTNNNNNCNTNGNTSGAQSTMPKRTHFGMKMKSRPKNRVTIASPEPPAQPSETGFTADSEQSITLPYPNPISSVSSKTDLHNNNNNINNDDVESAVMNKSRSVLNINSYMSPQKLTSPKKSTNQTQDDLKPSTLSSPLLAHQEPVKIETASVSESLATSGASPSKVTRNSSTPIRPSSPSQASSASFVKNITNSSMDQAANKSNSNPATNAKQQISPKKVVGLETPFCWSTYLNLMRAVKAPVEAFRQSPLPLVNNFRIGMKLEAKDPRANSWCLASVINIEGLRLRLRADGGDTMSDFFELIDSENIRQCGSKPMEILLPPTAYQGNLSTYPRYVEKVLSRPETVLAPEHCFVKPPPKPATNLFKTGMKLEAIDRKNPHLVCPATVGTVTQTDVQILFDGWSGSFDYACKYFSREIFPVNWCADTGHRIQPPNGWESLVHGRPDHVRLTKSPTPRKDDKDSLLAKKKKKKKQMFKSPALVRDLMSKSKKMSPSLTNAKVRPEMSHSTPRKQPLPSSVEKEPKREYNEEVPSDETSPMKDVETTFEADDNEDVEIPPGASEYQCQRTRPYDEWRKSTSQSSQTTSNEEVNISTNSSSQSSTISTLHPSKVVTLLETPPSFEGPQVKRMKVDTPPPVDSTARHLKKHKYDTWTVKDVLKLIKSDESLSKYSNIFETHEIDGKAFVLLTTEIMVNHMGLKIGPVLKINDLIEKVKRA